MRAAGRRKALAKLRQREPQPQPMRKQVTRHP